jgi:UTP--glucose-1-phosphate uridylyltransferase
MAGAGKPEPFIRRSATAASFSSLKEATPEPSPTSAESRRPKVEPFVKRTKRPSAGAPAPAKAPEAKPETIFPPIATETRPSSAVKDASEPKASQAVASTATVTTTTTTATATTSSDESRSRQLARLHEALASAASSASELLEYIQRLGLMDDESTREFCVLFEQFMIRRHVTLRSRAAQAVERLALAFSVRDRSPEVLNWALVRPPLDVESESLSRSRAESAGMELLELSAAAERESDAMAAFAGRASSTTTGASGMGDASDGPSASDRVTLRHWSRLSRCPNDQSLRQALLRKVAVVKLNGGLGARMGCWGPKSALEVREGMTFLDMAVRQVEWLNATWNADVPLVLMNSFQTHDDTVRVLRKYSSHDITIHCVIQSCYPRLDRTTLLPLPSVAFNPHQKGLWYPPGHGDVWRTLYRSGVLEELLQEGREWLFISNVDNLGATVDFRILHALVAGDLDSVGCDFAMEVTPKTKQDRQGGVLVDYGGHPRLVEVSQVPDALRAELESVRLYSKHNTNNLWASARRVRDLIECGSLHPHVIVSEREVDGAPAVQLETAAGAAIECFHKGVGIEVDRSRFLPVKSTSDLLAIQSNLFDVRHGALLVSPSRELTAPPVVRLGPEFTLLKDFSKRFERGLPNMVELDHLTVSGDVHFGRDVTLKGTVIIVANEGSRIDVPDGSVLENKVVTGNLRILDN